MFRKLLFLVYIIVVTVPSLMKAQPPVTVGLQHRYGIYFISEEWADADSLQGAFIQFRLQTGIGATYDYCLPGHVQISGRVEQYVEKEGERQYVLSAFFDEQFDALLRILDLPTTDNMKVAILQYARSQDAPIPTYIQYILTDEDFEQKPPY